MIKLDPSTALVVGVDCDILDFVEAAQYKDWSIAAEIGNQQKNKWSKGHYRHQRAGMMVDLLDVVKKSTSNTLVTAKAVQNYISQTDERTHELLKQSGLLEKAIEMELEEVEEEVQRAMGGKKGGPSYPAQFFKGDKINWHKYKQLSLKYRAFDFMQSAAWSKFAAEEDTTLVPGRPKLGFDLQMLRNPSDLFSIRGKTYLAQPEVLLPLMAASRLQYKRPLTSQSAPKTLIVLLDDSGSMSSPFKVAAVVATFETLFAHIGNGLRILCAPFVEEVGPPILIETKAQCEEFKKLFTDGSNFNTDIGRVLREMEKFLQQGMWGPYAISNATNILIINDGEDDIPPVVLCSVPVHAVSIADYEENDTKRCVEIHNGQYDWLEPTRLHALDYNNYDD